MGIQFTARVIQVGHGHIEGSPQPWTKVRSMADDVVTEGPLPGIKVVDYRVVDQNGGPDDALCERIKHEFLSRLDANGQPVEMQFEAKLMQRGGQQVVAIVGFTPAARKAAANG